MGIVCKQVASGDRREASRRMETTFQNKNRPWSRDRWAAEVFCSSCGGPAVRERVVWPAARSTTFKLKMQFSGVDVLPTRRRLRHDLSNDRDKNNNKGITNAWVGQGAKSRRRTHDRSHNLDVVSSNVLIDRQYKREDLFSERKSFND